ncbi:hypothetical protein [Acidicapsa ligni]|uniref:hypothetical protein n=1 Tax=Acidicapsa ligni TaxID=542300 RepID=UPI0021E0007B|nr:hypothetical protein [Acidicapsa ligni]
MNIGLYAMLPDLQRYHLVVAIGVPLLGGVMVIAACMLMPRGRAKGLLTGAYMFLACLGAASLLFTIFGAFTGVPWHTITPFLFLGIVLTLIMGIFARQTIREYQRFEFRKLAAGLFRRSQ